MHGEQHKAFFGNPLLGEPAGGLGWVNKMTHSSGCKMHGTRYFFGNFNINDTVIRDS
jgi:hypothetical protein